MKEKKTYEVPEMKIYQVQKANIIATSTQTQDLTYDPNDYSF